ncbi:AmpG family muropeptide MFS transporter [Sphingomonas tabacisoli]|uniref:AmpG family muropeptide MFS transporter n=1 Tax=Sphingomonas tabacisoli TaxID=2249466 RepID=A0ABW4I336_9SPHN
MSGAAAVSDEAPEAAPVKPKPKGWRLLKIALRSRKSSTMLAFGFSSGLPFSLLVGTLTAWLGEVGVKLATIGVFSWIGLAYSFKFLWSPVVDRLPLPGLERLGRRKSWIVLCQAIIALSLALLALTDPATAIGNFVLVAFLAALASASHDIAIDAWRIDQADEESPVELLSAIYQFGYRTASIVGGAIALIMAARMSWPNVYLVMAGIFVGLLVITLTAPDSPRPERKSLYGALAEPGALKPGVRAALLAVVGASWLWAILRLLAFAVSMLAPAVPGAEPPSVAAFTKTWGVLIIVATVFVPLAVAALANRLAARPDKVLSANDPAQGAGRTVMNHLYSALVDPLAELSRRMGWGVLAAIGFILTYAICYNIWASFAYPFYLDFLKYTKDEVAFASKIFGIIMTMLGISLGGFLFAKIGRFPTILLGAVLPPLGNFLYADLAEGAPMIDAFAHALRLDALAQAFGSDERMMRLLLAICYENIATGLALTAFVAYVSSIVSKKYGAIQYALLSSLLSLVGTLGRGAVGEAFDVYGYAPVFRWTAATALIAVTFVIIEWLRVSAEARRTSAAEQEG